MVLQQRALRVSIGQARRASEKIPPEDFVAAAFDRKAPGELEGLFFLFSTPRSGSTYLSELLNANNFCLPHEYFQPFEYLPILATRWDCVQEGVVNEERYISALIRFRTSPLGWLGIGLHGEHLRTYTRFEGAIPNVKKKCVHLRRRDIIAQAVSYELAMQTGAWSSHFESSGSPQYSFASIKSRLRHINKQNDLISCFVNARELPCSVVYYEDLVRDPAFVLKDIVGGSSQNGLEARLKKQADSLNQEWIRSFSVEYSSTFGLGYHVKKDKENLLKKIGIKIFKGI
jgi:LPS sulfotransferase NodH